MDVLLKNKMTFLSLLSVIVLSISSYVFTNIKSNQLIASNIRNGLDTCYKRSFQSFTAKIIADKLSPYLEQEFLANTTACYEEFENTYLSGLKSLIPSLQSKVSTLLKNQNNLVEKISYESTDTPTNIIISNLGSYFEKLELTKVSIENKITNFNIESSKSLNTVKMLFYLFIILTPLLILAVLLSAYSSTNKKDNFEQVATSFLDNREISALEKENFFESIFNSEELKNTLELFRSYTSSVSTQVYDARAIVNKSITADGHKNEIENVTQQDLVQFANTNSDKKYAKQLDQTWNYHASQASQASQDKTEIEDAKNSNLSNAFLKSFDSLASKLIDSNIEIDYKVSRSVNIESRKDVLEQIICESLSFIVPKIQGSGAKKLTLFSKNIGGSVVIELHALSDIVEQVDSKIRIPIIDEFITQINGEYKIVTENNSLRMQLILSRQKTNNRNLSYVAKGSKKEILKSMQSESRA